MLTKLTRSIVMLTMVAGVSPYALGQQSPVAPNDASSKLSFRDLNSDEHTIPCKDGMRGLVLVFVNTECPIANSYHPALSRLRQEFVDQHFDFAMVHADARLQPEAARKHMEEYNITWPIVLDPGNKIARRVQAKVTPEAIVLDSKGQILYRGRIDDRYQEYGRKRPAPASEDLRLALDSISKNLPVPTPETKAIGCVIRYEKQ